MRRSMKRMSAAALSAILAGSLLAGCGSSSSTSTSTSSDAAAEETTTEAAAEETTDSAAEDSTTTDHTAATTDQIGEPNGGEEVTLWHYFEHEAEALNAVIKEYNESQSEIYIVPTYVSREELMKQYTIGAVSGDLPDIGMVDSPDMSSYISLGVFADITEYLNSWSDLDQFYDGPLSSCMDSEGNLYGLPNNSNCLAILCNMDLLNAAGVEPPTTWDEFMDVCEKTTDAANGVYGFAMCAISNEEGTFQFIPWLYGAGGSVGDIDSAEAVTAVSFLGDLVEKGYMSNEVVNWGQGDALNAFVAGKAAMLESGTWHIAQLDGDLKDDVNFEYKYIEMPSYNGNQATVIGGENFGVCSSSKHVAECADFLMFMQTAQNNADWCEIAGKLPVRKDAVELKDFWTEDERYKVFNDSLNFAVARGPHPQWPTISEAVWTAEQAVILGQSSAEDALAQAATVIDPIVAETPLPETD